MMIDREMKTTINNWILQGKEAFLLTGARQIGKTYLIRECLKELKYDYVELNFIERPELVELFENATNAQDLLMRLSLITDKQLNKGNTIIFFDEIQEFKDIVTRIKFLVEEGSCELPLPCGTVVPMEVASNSRDSYLFLTKRLAVRTNQGIFTYAAIPLTGIPFGFSLWNPYTSGAERNV